MTTEPLKLRMLSRAPGVTVGATDGPDAAAFPAARPWPWPPGPEGDGKSDRTLPLKVLASSSKPDPAASDDPDVA